MEETKCNKKTRPGPKYTKPYGASTPTENQYASPSPSPSHTIQEIPELQKRQRILIGKDIPFSGISVSFMAGGRGNKRKCPRRLKKDTALRLSNLSDSILLHILSFLPTKSAVATSVLSRRWQYLWTSTPNLHLNERLFNRRSEFLNFAERALVLRGGSSLVSFFLNCWVRYDESRINTWISSAVRYNVEHISLYLAWIGSSFSLPFSLFGCQSLVKLEMVMTSGTQYTVNIRVPSMVCLPRLKHLALTWVKFADDESTEKLLSHPLLEELIISYCTWNDVTAVNVNCPMLQSLEIDDFFLTNTEIEDSDDDYDDDYYDDYYGNWSEVRQVCFIGDNLKVFRYEGDLPPTQYCISGSTMQLREAKISVATPNHRIQDMDGPANRYCKLVNSLSMVQNLTLSPAAVHSLCLLSRFLRFQTTFPVFERVTQLNLGDHNHAVMHIDYVWLRKIFKRCPHLEHLNFTTGMKCNSSTGDLPLLRPMPSCFRTHLKKITLKWFYPNSKEQADVIHVLLNSAPVLEEMVLHCNKDRLTDSRAAELEREFNTRPKVSENCRVSIVLV